MAFLLLTLLACGAESESGGASADTEVTHGLADWSECIDYPTAHAVCDDVCAEEGKLCAFQGCDGETVQRYVMPECTAESDEKDIACDEEFSVSSSSSTSARCCCW